MDKIKQIKEWLDGDQNYFKGIELYYAHAIGGRRIFPIKPTCAQCHNVLKAELENILQIAEEATAVEAEAKAAEEAAAAEAEAKAAEEAAAAEAEAKAAEEGASKAAEVAIYPNDPEEAAAKEELLNANLDEMEWPAMKSLFGKLKITAVSNKKVDVIKALKEVQLLLQTPNNGKN
jgi:hypothetical protein